jgi:S-adenosylmethionine-diacylgycerolhomoserine-N-methlytransferase
MRLLADAKIVYHMLLKPVRGKSHAERMENFYGGQAAAYDDFRRRLLKGREELWRQLPRPVGGVWVDLGGGTGANLENFGSDISTLRKIYVVDLSPSLLAVAADRAQRKGWSNVATVQADATTFTPDEGSADVVTLSYSLTMIPNWFAAIENAVRILKPGGHIGAVDFYVSRKYPPEGLKRHRWFTRTLWPPWFATDNVFPSPDHLPFLLHHFERVRLSENRSKLPYVPILRTPYYVFVGRKGASV